MPLSIDDQARMPPMDSHEDVRKRQTAEDLRNFRKYLVDTGSVDCLVKLYKHIAKNELRMDNATLLKEFLGAYRDIAPEALESEQLVRENATLAEYNANLEQQIEDLAKEVDEKQRYGLGRALWKALISPEFWEGQAGGGDVIAAGGGLTLGQIYQRLCGRQVDPVTGLILVDLVRPAPLDKESLLATVDADAFCEWIAQGLSDRIRTLLRDGLLPSIQAAPLATEPPFETELVDGIRSSGLYPDHLAEVAEIVELDSSLQTFLEAAAVQFAGAAPS